MIAGTSDLKLLLDNNKNRQIVDGMRSLGIVLVIYFHVIVGLTQILETDGLNIYVASMPHILNIAPAYAPPLYSFFLYQK